MLGDTTDNVRMLFQKLLITLLRSIQVNHISQIQNVTSAEPPRVMQ